MDRRTGNWRIGFVFQHSYGGNHQAFIACIDRATAGKSTRARSVDPILRALIASRDHVTTS